MLTLLQEKRPLKRPRLGPPDVYPQEAKQKEDELTSLNVKHGFATMPQLSDEFGTAHNSNVNATKVAAFFNLILSRKEELMTLPDTSRKKQQINVKDNFWPVSPRTKTTLDQWFKDLAGNKPLISLAKKAPSFNKKEDIFNMLCDNQVSMQRAAWFIKLSSAYTVAVSEAKIKKRQIPDPATEWTGTLIKYMKDLIFKLQEYYQHLDKHNSNSSQMLNPHFANMPQSMINTAGTNVLHSMTALPEDNKNVLKHWNYCTQLSKFMYEESLLDKQEFLNWILELLEKMRTQLNDDGFYKIILPFSLQYMYDFVQSERLCRKLGYIISKKLAVLFGNELEKRNFQNVSNTIHLNQFQSILNEYMKCPYHKEFIMYLSTILQVITIECPTALVWCGIGDSRISTALVGSPLDQLPLLPSALPFPSQYIETNEELRNQLKFIEEKILIRSRHAQNRWCTEKWQKSSINCYSRVLAILDALDGHCFDRMDTINSIETLYAKIFTIKCPVRHETNKNDEIKDIKIEYKAEHDASTVKILCEWAVSCQRWGEHRAMAVAWLLDKRQTEVTTPIYNEHVGNNGYSDDRDSIGSGVGLIGGVPVFQQVLMNFLDHDAPVLEESGTRQNKICFINLVHLFSELIRHDVFSHNAYLCTLISRGDLLTGSAIIPKPTIVTGTGPVSNKPSPPNQSNFDDEGFPTGMDFKQNIEEFDDSNVDDDLDKLLQHIKEKDQQSAMEAPDSPKDPEHVGTPTIGGARIEPHISRHFIYTKHFPIYQDDPSSPYNSESNQRYILLFGVGKERDEKKHAVKKMSKEICKLFSKKFSIDVAEGGKVKKHSRNEFNFESTTSKCQNMAYFDQNVVTSQCAVTVLEMLNSFSLGNGNYLPVQEHVAFLFDLMEMALNIFGLIDTCNQILKELPEVEHQLMIKKSNLTKNYTTSLGLYIVGILRRYHNCLLLSPEQTVSVFEGLCKTVKHVCNPCDCSSAERCILAYLADLYSSCTILKSKPQFTESFYLYPKIKQALAINITNQSISSPHSYNQQFLKEVLASAKRFGKIDPSWSRQPNESISNIYNFVSNAIIAICRETDNEKLNDIAISCAELTACCNVLSTEWLVALETLCGSSNDPRYQDLVKQIDIQNYNVHNSLAVFTCILIARHGFSLESFVMKVALPALGNACNNGREITPEAEAGARISCYLLLKLFKTIEIPQPSLYSVGTSPNPINSNTVTCNIKLSCDRHLLVAAHKNIQVEAVLTVLKAILLVGDTTAQKPTSTGSILKRSGLGTPVHPGSTPKNMDRPADLSHILGTSELNILSDNDEIMFDLPNHSHSNTNSNDQNASLSDFAQNVLKQICSQEWVLERCLQASDKLCGLLIEDIMTPKQVQRLLHMICYPENEYNVIAEMDQKSIIFKILENLEQWTLRISWLQLQLMYKQTENNQTESSNWLDIVARAAIDVFKIEENDTYNNKLFKPNKPSTWLVAPLISKLPNAVQGRILRVAGNVLETTNFFSGMKDNWNEERNKTLVKKKVMNNQPFLGLVLACLKGQDEQKESLLSSLHNQFSQFLYYTNEFDNIGGIDSTPLDEMLEALQLRFSLLGGMFEAIQRNGTIDWTILLAQLVCQGVIDLSTNRELFSTVIDMMTTLIHSTLLSDLQTERDENKKTYNNLIKKLRKELGDKNNASIKYIRQLLPLCKSTHEVVSCEQGGTDMKGNKIAGFDSDKKQLRISDKQRVSVWDILEGHKNPVPLSWAWFGASKLERKPLAYEESHRLLKYHTHSLIKPSSYYYEQIPLPPDDIEATPERPLKDDMKSDTPSSVDQSPSAPLTGRGRGKGTRKPRKPKAPKTPPANQQLQQSQPQQPQGQSHLMQQTMPNNQISQMQINLQNQMNANIQQYQQTQIMQQGANQSVGQQQINQGNMQSTMIPAQSQNSAVGFVSTSAGPGIVQGNQQSQQSTPQWTGSTTYSSMQPQQTQQFYNTHGLQNIQRAPINPSSKQALSNMLRQKNNFISNQQQGNSSASLSMQQQRQNLQLQQQQQQQQQLMMRNNMRSLGPNQMTAQQNITNQINQMSNLSQIPQPQSNLNQVINSNGLISQSQMQQQNTGNMMNTNSNLISNPNNAANQNSNIMGQSSTIVQGAGISSQTTMPNQNNAIGTQNSSISGQNNSLLGPQNSTNMINQQTTQQFQQFNSYNQNINQQNGAQMMNSGFSQITANQRNSQAEYLAQQRAMQQVNRTQLMSQAPNVTMSNIISGQSTPSYRHQSTVGHGHVQQQFQQQRLRQQMLMQQGGMGMNQSVPAMLQNATIGQQTPNLVAQLQRPQNIINQQYPHQPPQY